MKKNILVKGITLLGFVLLISTFMLYRADVFDPSGIRPIADYHPWSDTTRPPTLDSLKRTSPEVNRHELMSSSKSMVVLKAYDPLFVDSNYRKLKREPSVLKTPTRMSSSKSSQVISPDALQRLMDTKRIDTSSIKKPLLRLRPDTSKIIRLKP
jgi:hypothetical protein